jgi:RNA polymerase sigma factor (sigma-70 family)
MTDQELLREYAERRSQRAFAELVGRHAAWVYPAALRQVRDPHLAQDVTQAVFIVLARKAASLRGRAVLSGWLFNVVRFAASRARRAEARRRRHERAAAALAARRHGKGDPAAAGADAPDWERLAPVLDDMVARLGRQDRRAILLRFYERKNFAEVGADLNVSEDAARKRVERAVGKLRGLFAREGVAASAAGLGAAMWAHTSEASVAASAAGAAAAATGPAAAIAERTVTLMTFNKLAVPLACAVLLLLVGGWAVWSNVRDRPSASALRDDAAPARAPDPPPAPAPQRLPQRSFIEPERTLATLGDDQGGGIDAPVREGDLLRVEVEQPPGSRNWRNFIVPVTGGALDLAPLRPRPVEITEGGAQTTLREVAALLSAKLAENARGDDVDADADAGVHASAAGGVGAASPGIPAAAANVRLAKVRWVENPKTTPDPAIKATAEGWVVLPLATATKINKRDPDVVMHGIIAGRTWEEFGFMKFDLSALESPPTKATLHASCFMVENTRGVQTPARLVFYRVKTEWDDTATHNFAKSNGRVGWPGGPFNPNSPLNVDPTPVATVEMPNPPPPGYNVSFDVTEVVADWVSGRHPNHGLMMRVDQAPGYSYQANLSSFDYRKDWLPKIVCVPGRQ